MATKNQDRRLTEEETALWRGLPGWFRQRNDPTAPLPGDLREGVNVQSSSFSLFLFPARRQANA